MFFFYTCFTYLRVQLCTLSTFFFQNKRLNNDFCVTNKLFFNFIT